MSGCVFHWLLSACFKGWHIHESYPQVLLCGSRSLACQAFMIFCMSLGRDLCHCMYQSNCLHIQHFTYAVEKNASTRWATSCQSLAKCHAAIAGLVHCPAALAALDLISFEGAVGVEALPLLVPLPALPSCSAHSQFVCSKSPEQLTTRAAAFAVNIGTSVKSGPDVRMSPFSLSLLS